MRLNAYKLTAKKLSNIRDLASRTPLYPSVGQRCRVGANGRNNLSVYNYDRWYRWKADDRALFKSTFPEDTKHLMLVGHFLEIPEGGFLDTMNAWEGKLNSGYMVSFNIGEDDATIIISDKEVVVPVGGSVCFSLAEIHSIPVKETGRDLWACVMLICPPEKLKSEKTLIRKITS